MAEFDRPLVLLVTLTVRRPAADAFRDYETAASRIMARHGGRIDRVIRLAGAEESDSYREVHLVRFETAGGFSSYRQDAELAALAALRAEAVLHTEVLCGDYAEPY